MFDWVTPELGAIFWAIFKSVVILLGVVLAGAQMIWVERRMLGLWQDRYGPNRVGWFGLLQVPADMIKIFFKEDWTPPFVDRFTFILAPALAIGLMLLAFSLVPLTPNWVVTSPDDGILFFFAIAGLAVYAVILGGWSSNSKYALLGGLRSAVQMMSYEVFMGLSLMGVVMVTGSFDLVHIVDAQRAPLVRFPAVLRLLCLGACRHCRDSPDSVRPAGGGSRTRRRLSHGILGYEVRHVLRRRVRRHRIDLITDGCALFRRLARAVRGSTPAAQTDSLHLVRRKSVGVHVGVRAVACFAAAAPLRSNDGSGVEILSAAGAVERVGHRRVRVVARQRSLIE